VPKKPPHPYLVLLVAILLPGFGHVLIGKPGRGMTLQMFMVALGFVTWHLTSADHSVIGRLAGGLFVYAMSIPDAYRAARIHWAEAMAKR
jgi:hypothetical protein